MRVIFYCVVILMSLVLVACVQNKEDLEEYVQQVKKTAKGKVEPLPQASPIKTVTYSAQTLRSPFVLSGGTFVNAPSVITGADGQPIEQQPRPDLARPREFLEQYPLSSYTMVGTLSKPDMNWGLVKDAAGMVYAVKVGDYIGLNSGIIVAITPDQIRLNETVPNGAGGWMQSRAVLNLLQAQPEIPTANTEAPKSGTSTPAQTGRGTAAPKAPSQQVTVIESQQQGQTQQRSQSGAQSSSTGLRGGY